MPKLFIRMLSPAVATDEGYSVRCAWMIQEDDGRTRARGETDFRGLSELIDPGTDWVADPGNVVVTVPSEHVLSLSCEVPGRSVGQIRRALPFVVEEFVTTDIESMHLASGELKRGAPVRVDLVERSLLQGWLDCLGALDIRPGHMYSEAELLPVAEGQASLLLDGDRALIRTPDQAAALDRENLSLATGTLEAERLVVLHGRLSELEAGQLAPELTVVAEQTSQAETALEYLAAHWRTADAVNLLQGELRPKQRVNPLWARWRPVAALVAAWAGVALVTMAAEAIYASHRADELEARSVALYRDIFPGERRVTNVRRQLQAKLGGAEEGGSGFLVHLGAMASAMEPGTRVQSLNYTLERDELAVDLYTGGFETLDRLKERLGNQGVRVEITSAEQLDNGVRARLRLAGPGAGA